MEKVMCRALPCFFICLVLIITSSFLALPGPLSRISLDHALAADSTTDTDGDGILDDGDNSGVLFDNPCTSGETAGCDDNCLEFYNPEQIDVNSDGNGDICECKGDFEADGDVDGTNLSQILEHFGRNPYINPCIPEDPCTADHDGTKDNRDHSHVGGVGAFERPHLHQFTNGVLPNGRSPQREYDN